VKERATVSRLEATLVQERATESRLESDLASEKREVARLADCFTPVSVARPPLLFTPPKLTIDQQTIVDQFHRLLYDVVDEHAFRTYCISWLGYGMLKWPTDMWNYQEIIAETAPDVIIETGTHRGGSALFFATICDLIQHGEVISIDIDDTFRSMQPRHQRLTFLSGSSTDPAIVAAVKNRIGDRKNILVILDSDHRLDHVLNELRIYNEFVPVGGYLVVEDTNVNGHPAFPEFGPGPREAVDAFLAENPHFEVDTNQERFYWTHNPNGFLRRRST
jgi:cephalosporin hydroxylase